ncbi:dihydrolipoyl dehydrogenase family protein [Pseudonocardia nigra]|uniref:dihydrolipoyl dehydrogenase family protein n=1 Tax=Pseudonocardia nigra TaxID=1921578 RepID=UPI001C5D0EBD|nr:NAD(P)/FAD-dependent oxidoreductase [Pseudonocardia nigra]
MSEQFDTIVIGMGPGGEVAASRLLAAGQRVAAIEKELIGGECGYWACIPSKTLLRPPEARGEVERAAGVDGARLDWPATRAWRDDMIRHLDDGNQVTGYEKSGATVVKGASRITGPGTVEVDGRTLRAAHLVIATGSDAVLPPVDGLDTVPVWTNREATTLTEIPDRVVMLGGSAVGSELGGFLHRFGARVTIVERSATLLSREEPRVGELLGERMRAEGIDVRTGVTATAARRDGADVVLALDDGSQLRCDVVVVGAGRRPRTADLGLDAIGVTPGPKGEITVDEHCQAADGVWAIGDVTAIMPFTHVAKYQARIATDAILGRPHPAGYGGIPRVVFTDPEVAAVGLTTAQADRQGRRTVTAELDLAGALARPWTYEQDPWGHLGLLADPDHGVLLGAWAVAPMAGEWIHQAALAVRTAIPIAVLLDQVAQFPTYSEGFLAALEKLDVSSARG